MTTKHPLKAVEDALSKAYKLYDYQDIQEYIQQALTTLLEYIAMSEGKVDLDNAREAFENWLTGNGNYPHLKHKSFGGNYLSEEAAMKWDGFKAGYYAQINAAQDKGYKNDDQ